MGSIYDSSLELIPSAVTIVLLEVEYKILFIVPVTSTIIVLSHNRERWHEINQIYGLKLVFATLEVVDLDALREACSEYEGPQLDDNDKSHYGCDKERTAPTQDCSIVLFTLVVQVDATAQLILAFEELKDFLQHFLRIVYIY